MKKWIIVGAAALALSVPFAVKVIASDHDDGETEVKGRNLNLTDLYVFREDWQTGTASDASNLIFIMNSNPRSLPKQQYYFSTVARYEFHVSRAGTDNTVAGTTNDDIIMRFTFDAPDSNSQQAITLTTIKDGVTTTTSVGKTTPLGSAVTNNSITVDGKSFTVFAGHREDPFFFDVNAFFKFRYAAATGATAATALANFTTPGTDFTTGYNVNAIVVRAPITYFQKSSETVLDVWETISIPQ